MWNLWVHTCKRLLPPLVGYRVTTCLWSHGPSLLELRPKQATTKRQKLLRQAPLRRQRSGLWLTLRSRRFYHEKRTCDLSIRDQIPVLLIRADGALLARSANRAIRQIFTSRCLEQDPSDLIHLRFCFSTLSSPTCPITVRFRRRCADTENTISYLSRHVCRCVRARVQMRPRDYAVTYGCVCEGMGITRNREIGTGPRRRLEKAKEVKREFKQKAKKGWIRVHVGNLAAVFPRAHASCECLRVRAAAGGGGGGASPEVTLEPLSFGTAGREFGRV